MEEHIGYRHSLAWWRNPQNQNRAKAFRQSQVAKSSAPARAQRPESISPYLHGTAQLLGRQRGLYFDLGSVYTIMDDTDYESIVREIR